MNGSFKGSKSRLWHHCIYCPCMFHHMLWHPCKSMFAKSSVKCWLFPMSFLPHSLDFLLVPLICHSFNNLFKTTLFFHSCLHYFFSLLNIALAMSPLSVLRLPFVLACQQICLPLHILLHALDSKAVLDVSHLWIKDTIYSEIGCSLTKFHFPDLDDKWSFGLKCICYFL